MMIDDGDDDDEDDDDYGDDDDDGDDDENLYTPPLAPTRQTLGSSREVAKDPANTFPVSIVIIIAYIQKTKSLIFSPEKLVEIVHKSGRQHFGTQCFNLENMIVL